MEVAGHGRRPPHERDGASAWLSLRPGIRNHHIRSHRIGEERLGASRNDSRALAEITETTEIGVRKIHARYWGINNQTNVPNCEVSDKVGFFKK